MRAMPTFSRPAIEDTAGLQVPTLILFEVQEVGDPVGLGLGREFEAPAAGTVQD